MSPRSPAPKKRRVSHKIETKQEALRWMGAKPDGSFAKPRINPDTNKPVTHKEVTIKYGISAGLLADWKKKSLSIMPDRAVGVNIKNLYKNRLASFPELESILFEYMQNTVSPMRRESLFREQILIRKALEICSEIIARIDSLLSQQSQESNTYSELSSRKERLSKFKASAGWAQNFINRHKRTNRRGIGDGGFFLSEEIDTARSQIKQKLCKIAIEDISNTDEVAVLYRSFPIRAVRESSPQPSYRNNIDRLTTVLTVYADGSKAPLTIIGKSARPCSFPTHFNSVRDLNVFYKSQKNAWSTKSIWASFAGGFDEMGRLEDRKVFSVLDSCSAHTIHYDYPNYKVCLLNPNLSSHLQPVNLCVASSFKYLFRKLLINHIKRKTDSIERGTPSQSSSYKLSRLISVYDGVVLMSRAWDLVPKRVILRGWLKSKILVPHQTRKVKTILQGSATSVEPARKIIISTASQFEKDLHSVQAKHALEEGSKWAAGQARDVEGDVGSDTEHDNVDINELTCFSTEDLNVLRDLPGIEKFSHDDLARFLAEEKKIDVAAPVSDDTVLAEAVDYFFDGFYNIKVAANDDSDGGEREDPIPQETVTAQPSVPRFVASCERLITEIDLLRQNDKQFAANEELLVLKRQLSKEIFTASEVQCARRRDPKSKTRGHCELRPFKSHS